MRRLAILIYAITIATCAFGQSVGNYASLEIGGGAGDARVAVGSSLGGLSLRVPTCWDEAIPEDGAGDSMAAASRGSVMTGTEATP